MMFAQISKHFMNLFNSIYFLNALRRKNRKWILAEYLVVKHIRYLCFSCQDGYGKARLDPPVAFDEFTVSNIGSTTKAFTAALIGVLITESKQKNGR